MKALSTYRHLDIRGGACVDNIDSPEGQPGGALLVNDDGVAPGAARFEDWRINGLACSLTIRSARFSMGTASCRLPGRAACPRVSIRCLRDSVSSLPHHRAYQNERCRLALDSFLLAWLNEVGALTSARFALITRRLVDFGSWCSPRQQTAFLRGPKSF